ncbi:MAG: M23 family metallopeptidase [Sandaracinaceae bacterium]|nr:M23 family metallopeptidase [Sandaracinaceae bacterium]
MPASWSSACALVALVVGCESAPAPLLPPPECPPPPTDLRGFEEDYSALVVEIVGTETAPVLGTDERWHVVYELRLLNVRPVEAELTALEVLDYDARERRVSRLEGDALLGAMRGLTLRPVEDRRIAPDAGRVVFVELAFDARDDVPARILHRVEARAAANPGSREPVPVRYLAAPWDISRRTTPRIAPPVRGRGWVAINGCCDPGAVHRDAIQPVRGRMVVSQRFAIDWQRLDDEGRFFDGDPSALESWAGFDEPLYAVADGVVVQALDALDDITPGSLPEPGTITLQTVDGNHVILDLGGGVHAFYAHLRRGSVRVAVGDRVVAGQEIGRLGNTGNTSAPHLHLHLMAEPSALGADGIPHTFTELRVAGRLDRERWRTAPDQSGQWFDRAAASPDDRVGQLPLDLSVVDFPD